ncbi:uncharacterized protein J3R85_003231 [Psidium guajava]|nr:uncharacterized protein J3R85_003231 [Psidium guajava]
MIYRVKSHAYNPFLSNFASSSPHKNPRTSPSPPNSLDSLQLKRWLSTGTDRRRRRSRASSGGGSPDENGIKKVIEYKFNEEGNKVKITTTTRVRKLAKARLSKSAVEGRNWAEIRRRRPRGRRCSIDDGVHRGDTAGEA